MKIRTDFVSNSSSSSFILQNDEAFSYFNITKQDIVEALTEMIGPEVVEKYSAHHKEVLEEFCDSNKKELKYSSFGPFYVYDMTIKADRKEAFKRWGGLLGDWMATDCELDENGNLCGYSDRRNSYMDMCSAVSRLYDFDDFYDYKPKKHMKIHCCVNGKHVLKNAPEYVIKFLEDAYKKSGILTNKQVLEHECARFFIHFDDNMIWTDETNAPGKNDNVIEVWNENNIELAKRLGKTYSDNYSNKHNLSEKQIIKVGKKRIKEHNEYAKKQNRLISQSKFESKYSTKDRVFEVLFNHLVKAKKIKPNDEKFLSECFEANDWEKKNGSSYHTANGKNYSWRDLENSCLTFNGHEG